MTPRTILQISIGHDSSFADGDVISCCTWRKARHVTVHKILFRRQRNRRYQRLNGAGLFDFGDPAEDYHETCFQYKHVRTGRDTAIKVRLSDGAEIPIPASGRFTDFSGVERVFHVRSCFQRELQLFRGSNARGKCLFGNSDNNAVFYGGRETYEHTELDECWRAVQTKLRVRESDAYNDFTPFSNSRKRLWLPISDVSDATADSWSSPRYDRTDPERPVIVLKREHYVQWRSLGLSEADVLNKRLSLRLDRESLLQVTVEEKA